MKIPTKQIIFFVRVYSLSTTSARFQKHGLVDLPNVTTPTGLDRTIQAEQNQEVET